MYTSPLSGKAKLMKLRRDMQRTPHLYSSDDESDSDGNSGDEEVMSDPRHRGGTSTGGRSQAASFMQGLDLDDDDDDDDDDDSMNGGARVHAMFSKEDVLADYDDDVNGIFYAGAGSSSRLPPQRGRTGTVAYGQTDLDSMGGSQAYNPIYADTLDIQQQQQQQYQSTPQKYTPRSAISSLQRKQPFDGRSDGKTNGGGASREDMKRKTSSGGASTGSSPYRGGGSSGVDSHQRLQKKEIGDRGLRQVLLSVDDEGLGVGDPTRSGGRRTSGRSVYDEESSARRLDASFYAESMRSSKLDSGIDEDEDAVSSSSHLLRDQAWDQWKELAAATTTTEMGERGAIVEEGEYQRLDTAMEWTSESMDHAVKTTPQRQHNHSVLAVSATAAARFAESVDSLATMQPPKEPLHVQASEPIKHPPSVVAAPEPPQMPLEDTEKMHETDDADAFATAPDPVAAASESLAAGAEPTKQSDIASNGVTTNEMETASMQAAVVEAETANRKRIDELENLLDDTKRKLESVENSLYAVLRGHKEYVESAISLVISSTKPAARRSTDFVLQAASSLFFTACSVTFVALASEVFQELAIVLQTDSRLVPT